MNKPRHYWEIIRDQIVDDGWETKSYRIVTPEGDKWKVTAIKDKYVHCIMSDNQLTGFIELQRSIRGAGN
jgi:hypothetical protein